MNRARIRNRRLAAYLAAAVGMLFVGVVLAQAEVRVTAGVDRPRMMLGDRIQFTIRVEGTKSNPQARLPAVDGLNFSGPSLLSNVQIVNGQIDQSISLAYNVTATRIGQFSIPAIEVMVDGEVYRTAPVTFEVQKDQVVASIQEQLEATVQFGAQQIYAGQPVPVTIYLVARHDVPLRGLGGFRCEDGGLGFRHLPNVEQGTRTVNGQQYRVLILQGAIHPERPGSYTFGPAVFTVNLPAGRSRAPSRFGDSIFEEMMGLGRSRQLPVSTKPVEVTVKPLPTENRPPGFTGAVGQWNLEVSAEPREVAVGDPVTLTVKISGAGDIHTVSLPRLDGLDEFKTYDSTTRTKANDLGTEGERVMEQVLMPASPAATAIPAIELAFFDPAAGDYRVARHEPIPLTVRPRAEGDTALITGRTTAARPAERLGEDLVYLKGDLGTAVLSRPFAAGVGFWLLHIGPLTVVVGLIAWKRRQDRLRSDVAYARRSRAARRAHRLLVDAANHGEVQRALQQYLGDRLNLPGGGITAAIIDEKLRPLGLTEESAGRLRQIFEQCDTARFAGGAGSGTEIAGLVEETRNAIDELERTKL